MAIRVPIGPQVALAPLPRPGIAPEQTGQLLQQVGGAVSQVSGQALQIYERERQRADATRTAQLETEFQTSANRLLDDLLAKRGEEAFAAEQAVLGELGKLRDGLLEKAAGLEREAQEKTSAKLSALFEAARRNANGHVVKQRNVAMADTVRAREASVLDALARNFDDPKGRAEQMAAAEEVIGALSPTAEGRAQERAEFRQKAHVVVLERYLSARNVEGAKAYMAQVRGELGAAASEVEKQLAAVERDTEAEREAMKIAEAAADRRTGWVDEGLALAAVDALPAGPLKDEVRSRVEHRVGVSDGIRKAEVDKRFRWAFTAYRKGGLGAIPPTLRQWLEEHAPEHMHRLEEDRERRRRQAKSDRSEARREQAEANLLAKHDFMQREPSERAALDVEATYGGTGVNELGLAAIKVAQRVTTENLKSGRAMKEAEFIRDAEARALGPITDKREREEFLAEMRIQYNEEPETPSPERSKQLIDAGILEHVSGSWYWRTRERGFERSRRLRMEGGEAEPGADRPLDPRVRPGAGLGRPTKAERVRQLAGEGRKTNEIVGIMQAEGY